MIVTLSLYRYDGLAARLWAFGQMGFARLPLMRIKGLRASKLMGTGAGEGFSAKPNFGVYALMCIWNSSQDAAAALSDAEPFGRFRRHASQRVDITLVPTQARGEWAGQALFGTNGFAAPDGPVVALTRATIRLRHARRFWSKVPAISEAILKEDSRHFMIGMGEVPWLHQVTFSIWSDAEAMKAFSLNSPSHGQAVRLAYTKGWFSENLFARFNLVSVDGHWPQLDAALAWFSMPPGAAQPERAQA